jgi:hypothetical protein
MLQRFPGFPIFPVCLAISLASCASAPPAAGPSSKAPAPAPKAAGARSINLLCHEGARAVRFDKVGVPEGERPVDVALTRGFTWVLFDSGRVVQLSRSGENLALEMRFLPVKAEIGAIAVDPLDDSVWVVSSASVNLYRIATDGRLSTVKLQRKVEGAGGFSGLLVARDAIYAQPTCAESAVWRLDRAGKLLGTAFNAPPRNAEEESQVYQAGNPAQDACYSVRLERDQQGHILAWNRREQKTYEVDGEGRWNPSESRLFAHFREAGQDLALKVLDAGEQSEQWYFQGVSGSLFFWKGRPVFVGNFTAKERGRGNDTVLYLPGEDAAQEILMTCNGFAVRRVATDSTGYTAVTDRFLILGEVASAPDLP